jgi:hypothetical protein
MAHGTAKKKKKTFNDEKKPSVHRMNPIGMS